MSEHHGQPVELPLSQSEWLRVTLASIGDAVVTTDTDGRVTFLNRVAETLTGWTESEARGQPLEAVFRIINQHTRNSVENPTVRALRDGVIIGLANHTILISRDGTERPIDDSAAPIRNDEGEVAGVVLVFRDISERYRQEQVIQDALSYANNIIATLREPFVVLDEALRVLTANRAFYQAFRVTPELTEGRLLYDLGNRQWDIPRLRVLLGEVLSDHHPVTNFDVEHDFPGIGPKHMLLNAVRVRSPGDDSTLILLAIEDITDRKRAEHAVQVSEVRYRRLFETAKDGILILDAETGKITDANPFMTQLLGYSHGEFVGKELWEIGLFREKAQNQAAFRELQENGFVRYDHLPLETTKGERTEVEFVSNVYQVDSRIVAQCNIRDIGERSRLERKTHEQAEALADLHRRKDEFLAMLSHELRNPLAPISNAVQIMRLQDDAGPLQRQARTVIERQLAQLTRLVDDLLEVSRITTGRIRLKEERVTVAGIVERAVEAARPLIERRRHNLIVTVPTQPIWLYADAARLEQVVVNLLTNAAKYTDEGGRITLLVEQEGDEAVVRVRDTGVGISPELLPRIFDMFTQAERSLARSEGGLGIGLSLVQRLVELHRGRVDAVSALGHGSEFVVRLPVAGSVQPTLSTDPKTFKTPTASVRVLIVDDNVDSAETLASLLADVGHVVQTAYDGITALEAVVTNHPHVVLLDIGLPEIDGYEIARQLRASVLDGLVLVAVTGYGQEHHRQRSLEAGFDHHLVKPVALGALLEILTMAAPPPPSERVNERRSKVCLALNTPRCRRAIWRETADRAARRHARSASSRTAGR